MMTTSNLSNRDIGLPQGSISYGNDECGETWYYHEDCADYPNVDTTCDCGQSLSGYHECEYNCALVHRCENCENYDCYVESDYPSLWNYGYKPFGGMYVDVIDGDFKWLPISNLTTSNPLVMGLELEVEYRSGYDFDDTLEFLTQLNAAFGSKYCTSPVFCIAKEDATVDVEFVTAPFTAAAFKKATTDLKIAFAYARERFKGFYAGSAGAHVHINKSGLSLTTAYAWIQFHYQNPGLIADIAQRSIGEDAEWCYLQKPSQPIAYIAKQKGGFPNRGALADSSYTIEHRYFRSNLRFERIAKNIEFLDSMQKYFNTLTYQDMARDGAHKLYAYLAHVSLMRHEYPNLYDYLVKKGYIACV